ncbi:putative bifunctional diguanylate cyclase/phosphodiesterase [Roseibium hamelinense]|uniref:putative bifunctional diguanylate cyclase/phosphodiesterase n=1 Tax=Roseibium hamelinense TaxID=150831 RepID=UPI001AD92391|nr:bifunctional diguanylate cyclase/phosphodiesterase [Roseibium hamelinense]
MRTRFVMLVACLFLVLSVVMIAVASYLDLRDEENRVIADSQSIGATVSHLAVPHLENHHYLILEQELESIAASGIVTLVHVYDPQRSILIDSDPQTSYFDDIAIDPLLLKAIEVGETQTLTKPEMVSMAFPVRAEAEGEVLGGALVTVPRPNPEGVIFTIWKRNAIIAAVLLLFCLPVVFHFGNNFLRPIKLLTQTAHRVSAGDFDAPFPTERQDEIGVLARAYQNMVGTIRKNMSQIHKLAYVDSVSGLPNREAFRQHFKSLKSVKELRNKKFAVMFIDLDRFKRVNDSYGHDYGDLLLQEIGTRFQEALKSCGLPHGVFVQPDRRPRDTNYDVAVQSCVARLGGDEFGVIMPLVDEREAVLNVADQLTKAVETPFVINGYALSVGVSIGAAIYPDDGSDYTAIMKNADIAMYSAKHAGGNSLRFFDQVDRSGQAEDRLVVEAELRHALRGDELTVYYQPKVNCETSEVVGAEALVRWNHPERGLLAPGAFIDVAEETGLITRLGDRVLKLACAQGRSWLDQNRIIPLSVNVSVRQLQNPQFAADVLKTLHETGFPPHLLELEVTETVAMADPDIVYRITGPLRDAGIRFALDDFGTGYSSLAHLRQLPFDTFKIDQSFIQELGKSEGSRSIVQTILAMAQTMEYDVVAEGVETREQQAILQSIGCGTAQGYLFGVPMDADIFSAWMENCPSRNARRSGSGQTGRKPDAWAAA